MTHKYADQPERKSSGGRRPGVRLSAKELDRRLTWLDWLPVTWTGTPPEPLPQPYLESCRTTRQRLVDRLSRKAPGVYCIELTPRANGLEIGAVQRVTAAALSQAQLHLRRLGRGNDATQFRIGNREDRLQALSTALRAQEGELSAEAECVTFWLGPVDSRPSEQLSETVLTDALARTTDPGIRCALAAALGHRREKVRSRELSLWRELGSILPSPDLFAIYRTSRPAGKALSKTFAAIRPADRVHWWEAVIDQLLRRWPQRPVLRSFAPGLNALVTAADHLRRLPAERLNRLLHCIGEAMRHTDAFVPMSSGTGYSWNHPFMTECRRVLRDQLKVRLPATVEAGLSGGIQDVSRWFMGMELTDLDLMRLKKIQATTDADPNFLFMKRLTDVFDRRLAVDPPRQRMTLVGLCGMLADADPERRLNQMAAWVLHCREVCLPGRDGADPLRLAVRCLANSCRNLDGTEARGRLAEIAADYGGEALAFLETRLALSLKPANYDNLVVPLTQTEDNHENMLLLLASVSPQFETVIPLLLTEQLTPWLSAVTLKRPDRLAVALSFLSSVDDPWFALPNPSKWTWVYALHAARTSVTSLLLDWSRNLHDAHAFPWDVVDIALSDVLRFLDAPDQETRESFLEEQPMVLDLLTQRAVHAVENGHDDDFESAFGTRQWLLELTHYWHLHNGTGLDFLERMLERMDRLANQGVSELPATRSSQETELAVLLADGRLGRLITILKGTSFGDTICNVDPVAAWRWLDSFPDVQALVTTCAQRNELLPEISKLLQRIDLGRRLQSGPRLKRDLHSWATVTATTELDSYDVPPRHLGALKEMAFHRKACGATPVPAAVVKILDRPRAWRRELDALLAKADAGELAETAKVRVTNLQGYLADPEEIAQGIETDLAVELEKQTTLAKIRHLQSLAESAITDYWEGLCDSESTDLSETTRFNLLALYLDVKHNRRILKELIRKIVAGHDHPYVDHPVNRAFLKEIAKAGVDGDQWQTGPKESIAVADGKWSIGIEGDCVEVMRMGQIFGTCLRPGGDHSYAAVANAVEVNKQVIVIRDAGGEVVGRKLIVLSRDGVIYGFRSYGRGAVCKASLDRYCRDHADRCGAVLATPSQEQALIPADLELFARWYFDGTESFDPWITAPVPRVFATQLWESQSDLLEREEPSMAARLRVFLGQS